MKLLLKTIEVFLPITAILLLIMQVVLSNELTTYGKKVGELEKEVQFAQDENEALEIAVASSSALLTLREKAVVLGFVDPSTKQILNLTPVAPVAIRP